MSFDFNQQKRLKYLLIIFIILIIVLLIVFMEKRIIKELPIIYQQTFSTETISINFEVLKNPFLQELQPFEIISLPSEIEIGRDNPFFLK